MRRLFAVVVLTASTFVSAAAPPAYMFTALDNPAADIAKGERTRAFGINDAGYVVGDFGRHGFVAAEGVFATIDVPGATRTQAFGINNAGEIVGNFQDGIGTHGFVLRRGLFRSLDVPGAGMVNGAATRAYGINAAGQIVGDFDSTTGTHGFFYDGENFSVLDFQDAYFTQAFGINDAGDIVGAQLLSQVSAAIADSSTEMATIRRSRIQPRALPAVW